MKKTINSEDIRRLYHKGWFTTHDLTALGLTEEQATFIIQQLVAQGVIWAMPDDEKDEN